MIHVTGNGIMNKDNMDKEIKNDNNRDIKDNRKKRKHGLIFWFIFCVIFTTLSGSCMALVSGLWDYRLYDSPRMFRENINDRMLRSYAVYALSDYQDDFNLKELQNTNFRYAIYKGSDTSAVDLTDSSNYLVCTIPDEMLKSDADGMFSYSATLGPDTWYSYNIDNLWNCQGYIESSYHSDSEDYWVNSPIIDIIYVWNNDKAYVVSDNGYYFPIDIYFENEYGERVFDPKTMINDTRDGWKEEFSDHMALLDASTGTTPYVDIEDVIVGNKDMMFQYSSGEELDLWDINLGTWNISMHQDDQQQKVTDGENYYLIACVADPVNTGTDDLFARSEPIIEAVISLRYVLVVLGVLLAAIALISFILFVIRFFEFCGKGLKKITYQWRENVGLLWRMIGLCFIYGVIELFLAVVSLASDEFFVSLLFWGATVLVTMVFFVIIVLQINRVALGAKRMASGDLSRPVDTNNMFYDLRTIGECINSTQLGLERAVEARMKSERFKTELISNVSHDIKTPLTSIISYAELLKQQPAGEPANPEYLDTLERQSVKLKKLLEDLIEASKATTGNLKAELEPCNLNMVLHQVIGEYEEKLAASQIELKIRMTEEPVNIMADTQHLQRVLDNLFTNIAKYSQPGTRAYLNLSGGSDEAVIELKNTSREPLNMTSDELLERFVRGDSSRGSEGNGLGLSIAQSLTELMKGQLRLVVDGDLFKVILLFPRIPNEPETTPSVLV